MNKVIMFLFVVVFSACGQQLVEFPNPVVDGSVCPVGVDRGPCPVVMDKGVCPTCVDKGLCPSGTEKGICVDKGPCPTCMDRGICPVCVDRGICPMIDLQSPDTLKADTLKADTLKADTLKADTLKADTLKADTLKADTLKADTLKADTKVVNPCDLNPVVLGASGNFAILAGSTVTNVGPTSVTGDLGVSPGSAVTGFPPGTITGAQQVANPTSAQAELDLTTAYNDAAGRTLCAIIVAGNLGGMTLAPGLYKSTSSLAISSGDLTLDAGGNADAVWIFQMASTLTTTPGRKVILAGGAQAKNIFWQVGSSATLGTTSVMYGTIMADQSITLNTGAVLNGRALARIGAVTMDSNMVVKP